MSQLLHSFELVMSHGDLCKAVEFWLNSVVLQSPCDVIVVTYDDAHNTFTVELCHTDADEN